MKRISFYTFLLGLAWVMILSSCRRDEIPKIGLVGGLGGFFDRGFNQDILTGFQKAQAEFDMTGEARESLSEADIADNIDYFVSGGYNLIITAGFNAASLTIDAAEANPDIDFIILDYSMDDPPANLMCYVFDVDQSSFPCGFLAAWWANRQDSAIPRAGFVAGPEIPEIRQFSESYVHGIEYFNSKYQKNVQHSGYFADSFTDTLQGARLADSLLHQQASIIFAFAGKTGNGALYKVQEAGKWAIGVDVDQYVSIPSVGPILLTSCIKNLGTTIHTLIGDYCMECFSGGTTLEGDLNNGGVGMAPFHEYESVIPDSIKTALEEIESGIKNGSLSTGWQ